MRWIEGPLAVPDTPEDFLRELGGPAVLRIPGADRSRARALVTLLHGDEPSGLRAVHGWLRSGPAPAVDVVIFLGAVEAALEGPGFRHRALPGCRDLNRCFDTPGEEGEARTAARALALLRRVPLEALVDLHNTSGATPPCALGSRADPALLALASLFAAHYVCTGALGLGSLTEATGGHVPSVVVECGQRGSAQADRVARNGLARFVGAKRLSGPGHLALYRDPVRVELVPGTSVAFAPGPVPGADLTLRPDVDRFNLETLPPDTLLGWLRPGAPWPLRIGSRPGGASPPCPFRAGTDGRLLTRRHFTPLMMTTDPESARGDCLCYEVTPIAPPRPQSGMG
ncbi:MAG: succinylglutamate desuccinylase/aspartoacylase family protein [Thermodesulfobacteriota bacterium]